MNQSPFTSQNKIKNDPCHINEHNKGNKSIYDYITDNSQFINKGQCFDATPPFIGYIPMGVHSQNIDLENELRGITRVNTKCLSCKYESQSPELASDGLNNKILYNINECKHDNNK